MMREGKRKEPMPLLTGKAYNPSCPIIITSANPSLSTFKESQEIFGDFKKEKGKKDEEGNKDKKDKKIKKYKRKEGYLQEWEGQLTKSPRA